MNHSEYEKMYHLEEDFWWFRGRREIVYSLLAKHTAFSRKRLRILDIGCGTGKTLRDFEQMGHEVIGADFSGEALRFTKGRGAKRLLRADACNLPIASNSIDLIVAMDIMEHVPDDTAMAREIQRVLRPGGRAILNVPAHPFLWSDHDKNLHHFRRYTASAFRKVLKDADLKFTRYTSTICALFPAAVAMRLLQRVMPGKHKQGTSYPFEKSPVMNWLLFQIVKVEARLLKFVDLPIGLSLLAIVRKK